MIDNENNNESTTLALLPLKNVVILPKSIIPIIVGRASSIAAVEYSLRHNKAIFITAQIHPDIEHPTEKDVFVHGTRSTILQVMRMPKGTLKILVEGICRSKIVKSELVENFITVEIEDLPTTSLEKTIELEALWRQLKSLYGAYAQLNTKIPLDLMTSTKSSEDMDNIVDTLAVHLNLSFEERQEILEVPDLKERIVKLCAFLQREIDILETEERIRGSIQKQVEKNQREYYLTEQMKAIQKELGRDDVQSDLSHIRSKLKSLGLSPEAHDKVEKELRRLEQMPPLSQEAVVSRNYIDWIISMPWTKVSKDSISLEQAEIILNKSHAGLKKPKERIIEFLAAKKFSKTLERSPIICLIGPPGVGKTSLGQSIAESLGREFVRISLGGLKDEAEIRGHRRTYIGAMPGKIIQAMRKAKTSNPVILLDEIDKMSSDFHGDPSSALLEVLDPEQNKTFVDHFLEVEYDLSKVMFIATANLSDGIPYALYDRMERIILSGYTEAEKAEIARSFLIPKNLKEYSLKRTQFKLPDDILKKIISDYTKEAGVRQIERIIAKLMRKTIQILLKDPTVKNVTITNELLKEWLGHPRYRRTVLERGPERIGLVTGLAWTEVGGDVLEIEVIVLPGKGALTLTGQLGDVMQESAHAALSYIRSRAESLGLKESFYASKDIHIHIPEGATPKDGPSAGITMCLALVSALTKNPTRGDVAMTGEITLRGRVLAIGGLKEKLLAARQYGIKIVLIPEENRGDVEEILKDIGTQDHLNIIFVTHMDEVLKLALEKNPFVHSLEKNKASAEDEADTTKETSSKEAKPTKTRAPKKEKKSE
ncbi:endopeptidase La [Candidatus Dependentiae bacterium]|nr:endopeptidase La [Candidatus Dependentiae bacterium]